MEYIKEGGAWKEVDVAYVKGHAYTTKHAFGKVDGGVFTKTGDPFSSPWMYDLMVKENYTAVEGDYLRVRINFDDVVGGQIDNLSITSTFKFKNVPQEIDYKKENMTKTFDLIFKLRAGVNVQPYSHIAIFPSSTNPGGMVTISITSSSVEIVREVGNSVWAESDKSYLKVNGKWEETV